MIIKKFEVHNNNIPCVYIAIGKECYLIPSDRIRLKIGLSRHMGSRRRTLRCDSRYLVETIYECPLPNANNRLEQIEHSLHIWLHNAPTAIGGGGEEDTGDYHIAEMLIEQFPIMARAIAEQYTGRG